MLAACVCAIVLTASVSADRLQANRHLSRAQYFMDNLRYPAAAKELNWAWETEGNDRPSLLRILELRGIVAAVLNQPAQATTFFRTLLVLDPNHKLSGEYAPRVTTIFYQAKGWIAEREHLQFAPAPPRIGTNVVEQLSARVRPDPLSLGKKVRFHTRISGRPWVTTEVNVGESDAVNLSVNAESIYWWAELIGERNAVLALIGSSANPVRAQLPPPPPPEPVVEPSPQVIKEVRTKAFEEARQQFREPAFRGVSYELMGGGVAALGIGTYFGWKSVTDRRKIERASVNGQGLVSGISQKEAFDLDKQVRLEATLANILWVSGAALAATGAALYWFGGRASVTPVPGGISVQGNFH